MADPWQLLAASGVSRPQAQNRGRRAPAARASRPRAPVRPHVVDPFAPQTDAQLQSQASSLTQAQIAPILKQIADSINARSASGTAAIGGLTNTLGGLFGQAAPNTAAAYGQAQQGQAALDAALAQRLSGQGTNLSTELAGKLGATNAPNAGSVSAGVAQTGAGAANAGFAKGSASLSQLLAQGASAQDYAGKLPGIAGLAGMQNERNLQSQLAQDLADQTGKIGAQAPGIAAGIYQHSKDQEMQKAIAKQSGLVDTAKLKADAAYKSAQIAYHNKVANWNRQNQAAKLGVSVATLQQRAKHDNITESQAATRIANEQAKANRAANQKLRAERERERHNKAVEKKSGKGRTSAAPWQRAP